MCDLEDEDDFGGLFEDGHWEWDIIKESLVFISDLPQIEEDFSPPTPTVIGSIEFKEDLDLLEQQRFRKRFQRKAAENDVIYLQDIKDVVCFTAPKAILTPFLINILHLPMTDRFIRALILYCQYYLQISDEMSRRIMDQHFKIRTPKSDETELEFRENLEDLRVLVAKEYSCIIMGGGDIAKYHHMGLSKKMRSLTKRDSILFESILRISIQIVWLALGRQSYNQIELEVHRLFKSEMYNIIEHKLNTKYESELSERELFVLFGHCVHRNRMINTYSPLNNEMHCDRDIDYRLMGLGVIKYPKLAKWYENYAPTNIQRQIAQTTEIFARFARSINNFGYSVHRLSYRLRFLECALITPEENLVKFKMSLGILGLPRERFDTMLKEIKMPTSTASSASSFRQSVSKISASRASRVSTAMRKSAINQKLYEDIDLPVKDEENDHFPDHFSPKMLPKKHCNEAQRKKWMSYANLISKRNKRIKSTS